MQQAEVIALAHAGLAMNAPLSDLRAGQLLAGLAPPAGGRALDLGCGWAELLLRLAAAHPSMTGIGIDHSQVSVQRGQRAAAERGLADRVHLQVADVRGYCGPPADTVLCIGASHAWGGTVPALTAIRPRLRPGGVLLFGDAYWERSPTPAELAALGAGPGDHGPLADLVDAAMTAGFRPLEIAAASREEWDSFESRWCAGLERWLLDHPGAPDADQVRATADEHRNNWLRGYRGVLGFAYLTLATTT
jgi:SAM-dependent methyltransferase